MTLSAKRTTTALLLLVATILVTLSQVRADQEPEPVGTIDLADIDINKLKEMIPPELLPPELQNITLPKLEDIQKVIKDKCSRVAGSDALYQEVEQAAQVFGDCMKDLVDFSDIEEEIKKAKPTGDLDTVFNKYCRRRSSAIECIDTFAVKLDVCLEADEKESKEIMVNITHGLLNFVCHKDGDQIALFIAEKGPECFADQRSALIDCVNGTLRGYLDEPSPSMAEGMPKLVMGKKQCEEMDRLQECMVGTLEGCQESTPANLVESLFKFVRRETPCTDLIGETRASQVHRSSSDVSRASTYVMVATCLMAFLAKLLLH